MNALSWLLALSVLIYLMIEAVAFHKATICRQEAWLKSTELKTRTLLTNSKGNDRGWHLRCRLYLSRQEEEITWQRLPGTKKHTFNLKLTGVL